MNTFLIIFLCFVILLMVGAGLFFMFGKRSVKGSDDTLISDEAVIKTRSVIQGGKLSIEMDLNQEGLADVWNFRKTEEKLATEFPSDIMRLIDKNTPKEEFDEIVKRLRENGGYVYEEPETLNVEGDTGKEELEGTDGEEPEGMETGMVDPLDGMQMPDNAEAEQESAEAKEEPEREEVQLDNDEGKVVFENTSEFQDDPELRGQLLEFVIYLLTNYREGKLSAEHLAYVENRFHMTIEGDGWDDNKRQKSKRKIGKYVEASVFGDQSLETIKSVTEKMVESFDQNKRKPSAEAEHDEGSDARDSEETQAPAATGTDEIVNRFFSRHGGKKDLIWERLGGQGNK